MGAQTVLLIFICICCAIYTKKKAANAKLAKIEEKRKEDDEMFEA